MTASLFNAKLRQAIAWASEECHTAITAAQLINEPCIRLIAHLFHATTIDVAHKILDWRKGAQ